MQRRLRKASRNMGFTATVSARALKVAGTSFRGFFHQDGTSPQRMGTTSRPCPRSATASTVVVGAML